MRGRHTILTCALFVALINPARGQGMFQNLDFEHPVLPLLGLEVPVARALPGWQGYFGNIEVGSVFYNTMALDAVAISLHTVGSDSFQPILGSYSVLLQRSSLAPPTASLAQTGQVPSHAKSLRFAAAWPGGYMVSFAGQNLPLFQVESRPDYVVMAADISGYAGQIGELRFTAIPRGILYFDNVSFSSTPIPEPTVPHLLVLAASVLAGRGRKRKV